MASTETDGVLAGWYEKRLGPPNTADEVSGYWLFVGGVLVGVVGIILFFLTDAATSSRGLSYALAALAPVFLMLGAIIRFPLRRAATYLGYLGALVSAVAVVWFVSIFPGGWFTAGGNMAIISLYSIGILLIAVAGTLVPLLTPPLADESGVADAEAAEAAKTAAASDAANELDAANERVAALEAEVATLRADAADAEKSLARFELFTDKRDEFRWRLRHRNGNVIATGGESYTARHNAQKGIRSVRNNARGAGLLRIEPEPEVEDAEPADADEPILAVPAAETELESKATFELFDDKRGEFRWRLRHDNGNILADSGEGYVSKQGRSTAIDRIKQYVAPADYLWFDPAGFEVYRDAADEWRWRLLHRNGNILADSGEGYTRRHDASRAAKRLAERAGDLEFEVYEDKAGEFRWRVESANGNILADSGEGYASRSGAKNAVERIKEYAPEADTLEIGAAAFEIFKDKAGEFRWRLRHRNGEILADSGEGYADRSGARDGIESIKRNAPGADSEASE